MKTGRPSTRLYVLPDEIVRPPRSSDARSEPRSNVESTPTSVSCALAGTGQADMATTRQAMRMSGDAVFTVIGRAQAASCGDRDSRDPSLASVRLRQRCSLHPLVLS